MLVELGTCSRPHGIKGGFHFNLIGSDSILKSGKVITLTPIDKRSSLDPNGQEFKISSISFGNKIICYLDGVDNRNITEAMVPFAIHYPRERFPVPEEGEFYISDLAGLEVVDTNSKTIGKISGFYDNGAHLVLKVLVDAEVIDVPFVEVFVPDVDIKNKVVTIILPEFDS